MTEPHWDSFEWDDENRKNGNVQHLRDHGIEPDEAEECFFHNYLFVPDARRFDDVYVLDGKTDRGRRLRLIFQRPGQWNCSGIHRLGVENKEGAKEMKKFAKLSKSEQEKTESDYHRMKPGDLAGLMSKAKAHSPNVIR